MKKIFVAFCLAIVASAGVFAQTASSEHLTFKGVPIDGTLSEYVEKMKQAGFSYIGSRGEAKVLSGEFAGFQNCRVEVAALKSTNRVNCITVRFASKDDWPSLEEDYNTLKSMLTEKYGNPSKCVERFQGYVTPHTDSDRLYALGTDKCTWQTTYKVSNGEIRLSLNNDGWNDCFVQLRYSDKANSAAVRARAMQDL